MPTNVTTSADPRPPALGAARVLMVALALFCAWALICSIHNFSLTNTPGHFLDLVISVIWIAVTAGIIHNGKRMRRVAWSGLGLQLVAFTVVSACEGAGLSWVDTCELWKAAGLAYYCLPPILLAISAVWMFMSDPRRLAGRS